MSKVKRFGLKIKVKIFIAFGLLLGLSVLMATVSYLTIEKSNHYVSLLNEATSIRENLESIRKHEKAFLLYEVQDQALYQAGESPSQEEIALRLFAIRSSLNRISIAFPELSLKAQEKAFSSYEEAFKHLRDKALERGFRDHGIVGELRESIHHIENLPYAYDKVQMLMLRRHEKDFLLRKDLKYQARFHATFDDFMQEAERSLFRQIGDSDSVIIVHGWLEQYQAGFDRLVAVNQAIGLKPDEGLQASLQQAAWQAEEKTNRLISLMERVTNEKQEKALYLLYAIFGLQFLAGIAFAYLFSNKLARRILRLQQNIRILSKGLLPDPILARGHDELTLAANELNTLTAGVDRYMKFARAIGSGDFTATFQPLSEQDRLGESLMTMRSELMATHIKEEGRNFVLEEVANFSALIRSRKLDVYDKALSRLVRVLHASQGGLFMARANSTGGQDVLDMVACYALGSKKQRTVHVLSGEGLVGEVYKQKQMLLVKDVPAEYPAICSGLGQASPDCLLVLPLMLNDKAVGVIELALFNEPAAHHIELATQVAEMLAYAAAFADGQVGMAPGEALAWGTGLVEVKA